MTKVDEIIKSPKTPFPVIPAEAGIQCFRGLAKPLDPGFHRGDDFLRSRQGYCLQYAAVGDQPFDLKARV